LPGKNILPFDGKPLIAHAIDAARQSRRIRRTVVSTDDARIAEAALRYGAEVPFMRPAELAADTSPELSAWQHALHFVENEGERRPVDLFVSVPATAPLRLAEDVDRCIDALLQSDADLAITVCESRHNPYFNMVTFGPDGSVQTAIRGDKPIHRRQDAPRMYDIVPCVYAVRPDYVRRARAVYEGKVTAVEIPEDRAVDIDCELDLMLAELLLAKRRREARLVGPQTLRVAA
jgi:N,N'-diacetyl-8-epilegionaminate cytidylyltransferase